MNTFARTFVALFVFLLLVLAALSLAMDPYALFDTPRVDKLNRYKPDGLNHMRLSKAYRANAGDYEALILGSSRTGRGLSCSIIGYNERSCYNASGPAASLLESYRYLQQQTPGALKTVYLGLDLFTSIVPILLNSSFVDDRLRIDHSGERNYHYYQQWLNDHFAALVSGQAMAHSSRAYRSQGKRMVIPYGDGMPEIYADGSWGNDPTALIETGENLRGKKQLQRFAFMYSLMEQAYSESRLEHQQIGKELGSTVDEQLDAFRRIVEFCHQHSVDLRLFINSAHAYYWKILQDYDQGKIFAYWKYALLTITEKSAASFGARPFSIFDFSGFHDINTEAIPSAGNDYRLMARFQDIMHFSVATGRQMIAVTEQPCADIPAGDWGACLTQGTLQTDLRLQRERYENYQRSNEQEWAGFAPALEAARVRRERQRGLAGRRQQDTI